ncbi:uncharacterized protein BT62DRAFT_184918 [Guyanagaster necrorhizus]|uniref:Uncharacterized protein n=1 Tax=Guyanagaster necrorhizus TaxID=856835 RepID=A0A9P8ARC1_9AGAR|nr:uncharacterized protein BT62DRAFT_184918 [Guyanagaster necrorhizus MCA 3950]KAG7445248.1 hypothetical protein BT62DRAFT_184918 [Guyanagaster necrorhizus MCA 3950]
MANAPVVLFLIPALAISLAVTVPLVGILVRFRANYTPKSRIALNEENATPLGFFTYTYWGMARRIYRIEGWKGFFKGYAPPFFVLLCIYMGVVPTVYQPICRGIPLIHPTGIICIMVSISLSMILDVPCRVILYRYVFRLLKTLC